MGFFRPPSLANNKYITLNSIIQYLNITAHGDKNIFHSSVCQESDGKYNFLQDCFKIIPGDVYIAGP